MRRWTNSRATTSLTMSPAAGGRSIYSISAARPPQSGAAPSHRPAAADGVSLRLSASSPASAAAWSDIAGGARGDVIATKWLVASGVTYFLLIRLTAALLWTATISAIAGLAGLGWKAYGWYETGSWLPWRIGDVFVSDLISARAWFLERDAVAGFLVLAIATGSAGLALRQRQMRKHSAAD